MKYQAKTIFFDIKIVFLRTIFFENLYNRKNKLCKLLKRNVRKFSTNVQK